MTVTSMLTSAPIGLGGILVHWVTAALMLLFFVQLPRYGPHRAQLWTWTCAWVALLVGHLGEAIAAAGLIFRNPALGSPVLLQIINTIHLPARMCFVALITMAALNAAGRGISGPRQRQVTMFVIVVGTLLALADEATLSRTMLLLATPLLFFVSALLLIAAARGERERGLNNLALGMVLFAILTTTFQVVHWLDFFTPRTTLLLSLGSGYGMTLAAILLGGSVVVLVVQDSVLQAAQAREDHLRDIATSEARLKRIIEAAGEAILTFAADRRIDLANAAAARLFRLPTGALVGRLLDDLIDLGDASWDDVLAPVRESQPGQVNLVGSGIRGTGQNFPVEFTLGALDLAEQSGGGVAILRDLSTRRAAEREREQFERRVAESEKMLAIGRVVSGVAHELNNPLAVVLGQSEDLVSGDIDDDTRAGLQLINEQAHRARHIVKDLLAFVRLPEDRGEPVQLVTVVRRVVDGQQRNANGRSVKLIADLVSDGPSVRVDRPGLEQVLVNLIDNAMDAAGAGGWVRLSVGERDGKAVVTVEDNGPGVPDEIVPRIFEPFFTTKPTGQGTGLGLAVSVGMLEQYGGSLQLENRPAPGVGARFVVSLPRYGAEAPVAPGIVTPTPTGVSSSPRVAAGSVLLIDDEQAVRATIARIFRRWGWQVTETNSGREALNLLTGDQRIDLDLILCDLKMPEMTGSEIHAALKSRSPELLTKLIFVTGDVVEPDTAKFLATANTVVVEKPFTMAEIARAVEQVIRGSN
jgi:PAS domain S-box-containing protein